MQCDEKPPVCGNCKRRKLKCDYEDLFKVPSPNQSPLGSAGQHADELNIVFEFSQVGGRSSIPESHPNSSSDSDSQGTAEEISHFHDYDTLLPVVDHYLPLNQCPTSLIHATYQDQSNELLSHFVNFTAQTLSHNASAFQYWQQIAFSVAHAHDFVRHTLLAFSSLHIAHLQPPDGHAYLMLASHHHGTAIVQFKEQVQTIDGSNCDAIFIFSALLVLTELGLMRPVWNDDTAESDPIDNLLQQLMVIRKVLTLWRDTQQIHSEPTIRELIGHEKEPLDPAVVADITATLSYLEMINRRMVTDLEEKMIYSKAIRELGISYYFVHLRPNTWFPILRWAKGISPEFIERLRMRSPLALLILAQYCVLVHSVSVDHWWMRGWSEGIFEHVVTLLDSSWSRYLSSAMTEMRGTGPQ